MKLKLDDNGHAALKDGFPVWGAGDGKTGAAIDLGHGVFPHPSEIPLRGAWLGLVELERMRRAIWDRLIVFDRLLYENGARFRTD